MAKLYNKPGTAIKEVLKAWGITEHSGCGCTDLANEMDRDGSDKVALRLDDYYVPEMYKSVERWRGVNRILTPQPPMIAVKLLIEYGIKKSRDV